MKKRQPKLISEMSVTCANCGHQKFNITKLSGIAVMFTCEKCHGKTTLGKGAHVPLELSGWK